MKWDDVFQSVNEIPNNQLIDYLGKTMLKLSNEELKTILFVYLICFAIEQDIQDLLTKGIHNSDKLFPENINSIMIEIYRDRLEKLTNKSRNTDFDLDNLQYFSDKIKAEEKIFGKNDLTKFCWKINDLRNDLSHGRVKGLQWKEESLYSDDTKKKIISEYIFLLLNYRKSNAIYLTDIEKEKIIEK